MKFFSKQVAGAGVLALAFTLGATALQAAPLPAFQGYGQGPGGPGPGPGGPGGPGGWDAPPSEYRNDVMRQGFRDGIVGAQKDVENHRRPNVNNRDEYRHPDVPRPARHDYRVGFRRGYQTAMAHMAGGGPRPY